MRVMLKSIFLLALTCSMLAEFPSKEERDAIIECHTILRERVKPTASNMQLLTYSTKMEQLAHEFVSSCEDHIQDFSKKFQNVGIITPYFGDQKPPYQDVLCDVDSSTYNFEQDHCFGSCYDYKQMVWAASTEVGCAIHQCPPDNSDLRPFYDMACVYSPGEMTLVGRPYKEGPSCSNCPQGYGCHRKQCYAKPSPPITSTLPQTTTPSTFHPTEITTTMPQYDAATTSISSLISVVPIILPFLLILHVLH
uniref:SCP domain-containing protein n=2 Tax=Mesocestoides corti TaxID=53468 RepID=A0A5K3F154_MESCO